MKLQKLKLKYFLGSPESLNIDFDRITLICGPNESGKTRVRDAINFALTGELCRGVTKKKDHNLLVSEGHISATVELETDKLSVLRELPGGHANFSGDGALLENRFMPFCIDMHRFSSLPIADRREFLIDLAGIETTPGAIGERLIAQGCDAQKVDLVIVLTRLGFQDAIDEAKDQARQAKANWRDVTKKTWSPKNGDTWAPESPAVAKPPYPPEDHGAKMAGLEIEIHDLEQRKAKGESRENNVRFATERIADMNNIGTDRAQIDTEYNKAMEDKLAIAKEIKETKQQIEEILAKRPRSFWLCPNCESRLMYDLESTKLVRFEQPESADDWDEDALISLESKIADLIEFEDELKKEIHSLERKIYAIDGAERANKELGRMLSDLSDSDPGIDVVDTGQRIKQLRDERASLEAFFNAYGASVEDQRSAAESAISASKHHGDVLAWLHIAEALSPAGVQSELAHEALHIVNDALDVYADESGMDRVMIHNDMVVSSNYRPYHLLSESRQWRVDAVLSLLVSQISGLGFTVFDRFDILDIPSRGKVLGWLYEKRETNQAIVLGTLKAPPAAAPWLEVHWLGEEK